MGFIYKYLIWFKLGAIALLVAAACYRTWFVTSNYFQKIIDEKQVKADKAVQDQLTANVQLLAENAALRKSAEEYRAKNQLVVNGLTAQLNSLRIHFPSSSTVCADGTSGKDSNGRAGILSEETDTAFAELQRGDNEDFARCDQLNLDAIQANESVKR